MYAVAPEKVAGLNWAVTPMEKKYTSIENVLAKVPEDHNDLSVTAKWRSCSAIGATKRTACPWVESAAVHGPSASS